MGKLYTVIMIDQDLSISDTTEWTAVLEKLKPVDVLLKKIGLSDVLFPQNPKKITANQYLIILEPDTEYLSVNKIIRQIIKLFIYYIVLGFIYNYVDKFYDISNIIQELIN